MRASRHADGTNVTYKDYAINFRFARLFTILFGGSPRLELEIKEPDNSQSVTREVAAMTPGKSDQVDQKRYQSETDCDRLCMTFSDDNSYAVLTIKNFDYYEYPGACRTLLPRTGFRHSASCLRRTR